MRPLSGMIQKTAAKHYVHPAEVLVGELDVWGCGNLLSLLECVIIIRHSVALIRNHTKNTRTQKNTVVRTYSHDRPTRIAEAHNYGRWSRYALRATMWKQKPGIRVEWESDCIKTILLGSLAILHVSQWPRNKPSGKLQQDIMVFFSTVWRTSRRTHTFNGHDCSFPQLQQKRWRWDLNPWEPLSLQGDVGKSGRLRYYELLRETHCLLNNSHSSIAQHTYHTTWHDDWESLYAQENMFPLKHVVNHIIESTLQSFSTEKQQELAKRSLHWKVASIVWKYGIEYNTHDYCVRQERFSCVMGSRDSFIYDAPRPRSSMLLWNQKWFQGDVMLMG